MPNPIDNLAGVSWPQKRTCHRCRRVFFAFTALARFCTPCVPAPWLASPVVVPDERIALIFEESRRALDQQEKVLDNLRARTRLLLSRRPHGRQRSRGSFRTRMVCSLEHIRQQSTGAPWTR
jgi:hypothetical protein